MTQALFYYKILLIMKVFLTEFHYKKEYKNTADVLTAVFLYALLAFPSLVYFFTVKVRNFCYDKNILKSFKPRAYTISVGNLTTGGTGKTPITAEIANYLSKKGERTTILSRGYGGKLPNKEVNVISDGTNINYDASMAGDEPYWLAKHCPKTSVLTCSNRIKSAKYAQSHLKATRLILDDGYQHRKIQRDLNLLVVDAQKQFSNGCVLPLGALREPLSGINRADKIIVVNKSLNDKHARTYARYLRKTYKKPSFVCSMVPDVIYNIKTEEPIADNAPVIAFSAIGQPEQFYNFLRRFDVMETKNFPDHHMYTADDIKELQLLAQKYGATAMITTEKDAVKLKEFSSCFDNIYALKLKPTLDLKNILEE